jgi:hypothetical protein
VDLPSVYDPDLARSSVPELEGRLCFTYSADDTAEQVHQRAARMLADLQAALAEYQQELAEHQQALAWQRAQQRAEDWAQLRRAVGAAVRGAIARGWAWSLRTFRREPALVNHTVAIAVGSTVVAVLAGITMWAWGWPPLIYVIAIAIVVVAAYVAVIAATVFLDDRRPGPGT